uniref:Protein translocase subunit SecF n=1 Tax=uncultured marine microorganism HF4000_APKG7H23 TaxID=455551 RepID=B3T9T6_9ZZZZ|nr:putative export membrane protein [uncultured marine microorganism HF4000_APKG7H23]
MIDIVRYRRWFFLISALLVVPSLGALLGPMLPFVGSDLGSTLRPGIEFTGGSAMTVEFADPVSSLVVREQLSAIGHEGAIVQATGGNSFFIRLGELEQEELDGEGNVVNPGGRQEVEEALGELSPVDVQSFDSISAVVGAETVRAAIIAVAFAAVVILFYITWAFRRVPSPFRYGTAAVVALVHDVVIVLGVFSILGRTVNMEVNAMFIIGVLTVIGYSVNDTIVVFDRVRENVLRYQGATIVEMVNLSIRETVGRSFNTSITLLVVVVALLIFGGPTIQPLLLVLLVGVVVGTYSSIFVASLMLVSWETGELGRALRRLTLSRPRS